ncbi:replication factor A protein 2 [Coelomomyces lativittatus]|nr:replication factor A protein 2 [Coelomomyces lativittatus]
MGGRREMYGQPKNQAGGVMKEESFFGGYGQTSGYNTNPSTTTSQPPSRYGGGSSSSSTVTSSFSSSSTYTNTSIQGDSHPSFQNTHGGGGGFTYSSGASSSMDMTKKTTKPSEQTLRPCTLIQLLQAVQPLPDGPFQINHQDLHLVQVVGRITQVQEVATHVTFHLHDGTAMMEVKWFMNPSQQQQQQQQPHDTLVVSDEALDPYLQNILTSCTENTWVRVIGPLKVFNQKRQLFAHAVQPILAYTELMAHLLLSLAHHLETLPSSSSSSSMVGRHPPTSSSSSSSSNVTSATSMTSFTTSSLSSSTFVPDVGHPLANALLKIMARPEWVMKEDGIHRQVLYNEVTRSQPRGSGVASTTPPSLQEFHQAVEWLLNEGHIFCTLDDDHFKSI